MPVVYQIDQVRRIIFTRVFGRATEEDLHQFAINLKADPGFEPAFYHLLDFSETIEVNIQLETIHRLVGVRIFDKSSLRAIVVNTSLKYGFARMFQNLRMPEDENIRVFWNLAEARDWLGLGN